MLYILKTTTKAMFDNIEDATKYYLRLKEDEEHAKVSPPKRDPNEGLYIVRMAKNESVQTYNI